MKKRILTGLGLLGSVVLVVAAVFLATPNQATAKEMCAATTTNCDCDGPLQSTAMVWGSGDTCTEAFNAGLAQSRALQGCSDGTCYEQVVVDTPCWHDGTHYMVDMHTNYRCYTCTTGSCEEEGPIPTQNYN